jgi:hypothetical protein
MKRVLGQGLLSRRGIAVGAIVVASLFKLFLFANTAHPFGSERFNFGISSSALDTIECKEADRGGRAPGNERHCHQYCGVCALNQIFKFENSIPRSVEDLSVPRNDYARAQPQFSRRAHPLLELGAFQLARAPPSVS